MLEFGQTIKAKREKMGLTQKQLGNLLYVSDKTVSRWENNQIYPDITMLLDISKVLEIDYQELIEGSDYIEKKKAKQNKQIRQRKIYLFCFICLMIGVLIFASHLFLKNEKIEETGIDYIVSKQWDEIGRTDEVDHSIFAIRHYLSDYEKDEILAYLDVDHWLRIEKLPEEAERLDYQLGFYTPYSTGNYKSEHYSTYQKNGIYYLVLHSDPSIVYQLSINPTKFTEFFKTLPKSEFSYDHSFINKSSYSLLTGNELLKASINLENNETEELFNYHMNGIDNRWYLLLTSSKFDIQSLDIKGKALYIKGEKRLYSKTYVIGVEVDENTVIDQIHVNDELKYDLQKGIFKLNE